MYDKSGTQVVSYVYDSWGNLISTSGTLASTVGEKNPYRYRGYRYDTETGLYYLQSRYYNPEWGRFINADGLIGKPGELLSHNMFAYCANNPINREDPSGKSWLSSVFESVESVILAAITIITLAIIVNSPPILNPINTMSSTRDTSKDKVTPISIPIEKTNDEPEGTKIYRWGNNKPKNLTPKKKDTDGLSFSLTKPVGRDYCVTTIEAINATGVLVAIKDKPNHVAVKPVNSSRMQEWIDSWDTATQNPHEFTKILQNQVIYVK